MRAAEDYLISRDVVLGRIIQASTDRWNPDRTEDPMWGLVRIVIAQQISTSAATTIAQRVARAYPELLSGDRPREGMRRSRLRKCGLSPRKAHCCCQLVQRMTAEDFSTGSDDAMDALSGVRGIGPWTRDMFQILVLRKPDVLPLGDAGLLRAVRVHYGTEIALHTLAEAWRPFRSVACWYLWRSLGNVPLG